MYGYSPAVTLNGLGLAKVQPTTHVETDLVDPFCDGGSGPHGLRGLAALYVTLHHAAISRVSSAAPLNRTWGSSTPPTISRRKVSLPR